MWARMRKATRRGRPARILASRVAILGDIRGFYNSATPARHVATNGDTARLETRATSGGACAGPRVVLNTRYEAAFHGVSLDITPNTLQLRGVADPMVIRFLLPEGLPGT